MRQILLAAALIALPGALAGTAQAAAPGHGLRVAGITRAAATPAPAETRELSGTRIQASAEAAR